MDEKPWVLRETRELLSARVFKVIEQTFVTPAGDFAKRQTVVHSGAVAMLPFVTPTEVILVRQFRPSVGRSLIEVPAGTLEAGEAPEECARRELAEEIGWAPGKLESLGFIYSSPGICSEKLYLYRARDMVPAHGEKDQDEFIDLVRVTFREALDLCARGEIQDSKTIAILLLAALKDGALPG